MPQSDNVRRVADQILAAFEAGTVPAACAQIFIRRTADDHRPCARWSWRNQLLAALLGHQDARGFRQWQEVDRHVRKGERAFHILAPAVRKVEPKDDQPEAEPSAVVTGFFCVPVFGYSQTDGEPLPGPRRRPPSSPRFPWSRSLAPGDSRCRRSSPRPPAISATTGMARLSL